MVLSIFTAYMYVPLCRSFQFNRTQQLQAALLTAGWHGRFIHRAVTTNKIDHADVSRLKVQLGLDAAALRKSWEDL